MKSQPQPVRPREKHPRFWMFFCLGGLSFLIGIALLRREEFLTGGLLALAGVGVLGAAVILRVFAMHVQSPAHEDLGDTVAP